MIPPTTQMSLPETPSTSLVLVSDGTDLAVQDLVFQCATMLPAEAEPAVHTSPARDTWMLFRMYSPLIPVATLCQVLPFQRSTSTAKPPVPVGCDPASQA